MIRSSWKHCFGWLSNEIFRCSLEIIEIPTDSLDVWQNHETKQGFDLQSNEIPNKPTKFENKLIKTSINKKNKKTDQLVSGD